MATEVVMPQMGESIAEGTITKWLKNVGDHVDRDEPLFEISTDKVDAEIPSPAAGTLTEVRYKEGETVEVNTVVAVLDGQGAAPPAKEETAAAPAESAAEPAAKEEPVAAPAETVEAQTAAAPAKAAASTSTQPAAATKPAEGDRVEQMSVMRKKIAEHMIQSRRTSAHVSTVYEIDMTKIAKMRDENREAFLERTGTKLTFMPFIFKAVTDGIRKFPIFNTQVSGDQIIYKRDINLGMAVALVLGVFLAVV